MVAFTNVVLASASLLAGHVTAHPGESHSATHMKRELVARDNAASVGARSLGSCSNSPAAQALKTRSIMRRADKVRSIREKRGLTTLARKGKRALEDLQAYEAINHNMTSQVSYDMFTPLEEVFSANTSCILAPYITDGPYYVVGEKMRSNVKEAQSSDGIDLFLEVQYIDVNTCEALPSVAIDVWNCNATGVYSGVESGQGGVDSTFLRGIQLTDFDGVATFETIFPGHYSGRAPHTHLLAHVNASVQSNGTISVWGAPVAHIGQLFYPDDLRAEVEATAPYNENTQDLTTNDEDMWSILQADENFDPIPQFVYLGDSIEDGLFAWIQIGINGSADYTTDDYYSVAAYFAEDGGHLTNSGGVGGGPPSGGNGTEPPSGDFPSGSMSGPAPTATA
ncbi:putative gpi anchored protein [Rosellinia necatrix]|uniref:Putative gpi anchored protein n=1 Tax=Rosellinia necatrix TaxID=77044 RepID=A0A1W2TWX0_ROSNE|nr:putative gpi anchored protein [Rosellinia necatrix]